MAAHTCNPSIWEVNTGGLEVQVHPLQHSELEAKWGCVRPCLETNFIKMKNIKKMFSCNPPLSPDLETVAGCSSGCRWLQAPCKWPKSRSFSHPCLGCAREQDKKPWQLPCWERWSDMKLFMASFLLSSNNNYLQLNFWKVKYLCFKRTESCCVLRQGFKSPDVTVWIWSAPPKGHIIEVLLFDVRALRRKGLGEGGSSTLGMLLKELVGLWLLLFTSTSPWVGAACTSTMHTPPWWSTSP